MVPDVEKVFHVMLDDILELSTENDPSKGKLRDFDRKLLVNCMEKMIEKVSFKTRIFSKW